MSDMSKEESMEEDDSSEDEESSWEDEVSPWEDESVGESEVESYSEDEENISEMSDSFIENVQQQESSSSSDEGNERERCPVCLRHFTGQDLGVPENCEHLFCLECIEEWGSISNTCPIDAKKFNFVHLKRSPDGNVLKKVHVQGTGTYKEPEEDAEDYPGCEVCRKGDREHCLLLCDACNLPYHCDCLDPPLSHMPADEWFCPPCASVMARMGDEALPSISQYRRVIPRTKASESIRLRVENKRSYPSMNSQSTPNASKDDGSSLGSRAVKYTTLPDRPDKPGKPIIKGRTHSTFFKMAWECPKEDGGCPITEYNLEMDSGNGFESIYCGDKLEHMCKNLMPGKSYAFRVQCSSLGGQSEFSDRGTAVTWPVVPGKCAIPTVIGKPKRLSIHVKWANPEYDGGAKVLGFVIELINPDGSTRLAYRGPDTDCIVAGLLPGRVYKLGVRAYNKVGFGAWSDPLEAGSRAGTPEPPVDVRVVPRSPHCVFASWAEPFHNGALISEYRLESKCNNEVFELVYSGPTCSAEVKSLIPATMYYFHVLAVNSAGAGPFSECVSCRTSSSSPGAVSTTSIRAVVEASAITLWWEEPINHGAAILSYNIEIGEALYTTHGENPERRVEGLIPETIYKVRVQAINSVGPGPFSSPMKLETRGLPPLPPILECCSSSHNSLSLKWGDGKNLDSNTFTLELEFLLGAQVKKFTPVYQGPGNMFKVTKLQELTSYNFRIYASNKEGHGPFSDVFTFTTQRALPPALKDSTISKTSYNVESLPAKAIREAMLSYKLQRGTKESDFHATPRKTWPPSTSTERNLQPAKGCIAKCLGPRTGTVMPDVSSNSGPSSQSSDSKYPLFDELMNFSENFNEHMVVPSTSTSTPRNLPRRSETCAAPLNLLDSILAEQKLLHAKSDKIIIQTDGSLFRKEDKEKEAAKKTSKLVVPVGSGKPDMSSKHTKPERARDNSSSLLHRALTKKKSSESRIQQKSATSSSSSAKDISEKTRKIKKREDTQATMEGNSCLSKKSSDLYSKHREKPIGSTLSISPVIPLKTDKLKDKHVSGKDSSSTFNKNLSNLSCDTYLASIPTSFPHFSDNKKQSKKSEKAKPSNMQDNVPDHRLDISSLSNVFVTKYSGNTSRNRQSAPSDESYTLTGCKVQKLSQRSPAVKVTSPQTNEIKIKDEPLSSDDKEAYSENLIGQANNLSITLKTEFQVSESLIRNSDTCQISSTTLNSSTIMDVSNLEVNVINNPTQSLHHSRAQSQPIRKESNTEKCNTHIENDKCIERNIQNNEYSEREHGHKESNSNGKKRKADKDHYCSKERSDKHAVKDSTARNSDMKNNYANKDKPDSKARIPNSRNKHVEKNKHSSIERNSYSTNKYAEKDVHDNREKSSASKSIHLDKDKYCSKKRNFDRKNYEHDRKEKSYDDSKKKYGENDKHDSKDRNLYNKDKHVEKDKHSSRVKNYDRKDKHTENDKHCHKERVPYSKFKHSEKDYYNVKESKYDKNNKPILKYSKDSYCDSKTKTSQKDKHNRESDSDRNNKHTEKGKFINKKSDFVKDGPIIEGRKRSFEASSIDFSSDKSNQENKRRNISTEVNEQNCSNSSKSCPSPDSTSGPDKTERLAAFGQSKHGTFLDVSVLKTMSNVDCDTTSSRKRRHKSMCSEDTSGCFSDISLSNEVLLTGPFNSPKLEKAAEQKHTLKDGRGQDFRKNQLFTSTRGTGQSHFLSPPYDGRDYNRGENWETGRISSNTWSNHSNSNSNQKLSFRGGQRNNYGNHRSDYNAPFHQQDGAGQSRFDPYSYWSRSSNTIHVNRFPQGAVGGMLHQSQEHWQDYWNNSQNRRALQMISSVEVSPAYLSTSSNPSPPQQHAAGNSIAVTLTVRLIMQGKEVGSIIGKKGSNIKKFRKESGAIINISDGPSPERIVTVTGYTESILKAFSFVAHKFEIDLQASVTGTNIPKPPVTLHLIVPASQCESLIGKEGSKIKDIRETTGASIQVASDMLPNSTERAVRLSGTSEALTRCIHQICCIMMESPPKGATIPYWPKQQSVLPMLFSNG